MTTRKKAKPTAAAAAAEPGEKIDRLDEMKVSELQAKFAEVVGETTRSPNKTYLLRRIREAVAAELPDTGPAGAAADGASSGNTSETLGAVPAGGEPTVSPSGPSSGSNDGKGAGQQPVPEAAVTPPTAPKLSKLDVPALQAKYLEVVGRPTTSESRNYLLWKIREAQKGHVPLGPREGRRTNGDEMKVLPLRLEAGLVDRLDEAWPRLGLRSRMDLFRAALRAYFEGTGERELADLLVSQA